MIVMVTSLQRQYLQLAYCDAIPRSHCCRLIKHFGSTTAIVRAGCDSLAELGVGDDQHGRLLAILDSNLDPGGLLSRTNDWLEQDPDTRRLVCYEDAHYPQLLREIACPPPLLFVAGDGASLDHPQLAIVGSRRSSCQGEQTAAWLAAELAKLGFCITSGLAAGIDSHAHSGALAVGGRSIAVLGTGIDRIYPQANRQLAARLAESGALVSEFALATPPIPANFPQRNRIIAGLAVGVIVVEAALRSGSLITARLAMESNREVFAVPGSIHSGNSRGCHRLIREGARLVENVDSVLEELSGPLMGIISAWQDPQSHGKTSKQGASHAGGNSRENDSALADDPNLGSGERKLLRLIGFDTLPAEVLAARTGLSIERVNRSLTRLEISGHLRQTAGRYQRLASGLQPDSD
jgi:DNA processing protein